MTPPAPYSSSVHLLIIRIHHAVARPQLMDVRGPVHALHTSPLRFRVKRRRGLEKSAICPAPEKLGPRTRLSPMPSIPRREISLDALGDSCSTPCSRNGIYHAKSRASPDGFGHRFESSRRSRWWCEPGKCKIVIIRRNCKVQS